MDREVQGLGRARKETVDMAILVTSKNGGRKIMQSINKAQTLLEDEEVEPVEPVQINTEESNINTKDLSWPHFKNEPRVQGRQQAKNHQSYISIFVAYLTILSSSQEHQSTHDNTILSKAIQQNYQDTEQPFLGSSFSNRDNLKALTQF